MQKPNSDNYVWAGIAAAVILGSIGVAEPATGPISIIVYAGLYAHWRWRKNLYDRYLARHEKVDLSEE